MKSEIKPLLAINLLNKGIELTNKHKYNFVYSRTGNVKYIGIYKPKYFKKEMLNNYKPVKIGRMTFLLFSQCFDIDMNKCYKSILNFFIDETNFKIKTLKENRILLVKQLKSIN